jgi:protein-S-isoprenylcysteine O-methyltransferase Ste14
MGQAIPEILLGVILAAYWGRVLRMAYKAHRRTGQAANLVPGEWLGKIIRIIWAPVIVIWVAQPFAAALGFAPRFARPLYFTPWIAWPALAVAGLALILSRICWKAMGRHWRMGIDPAEQNPLIDAGPFAFARHPIYSLSGMMMLATLSMIPSPLMLCAGAVHLGLLWWESRREEMHLLQLHGERYIQYRRRVGAFLPRRPLRYGIFDIRINRRR